MIEMKRFVIVFAVTICVVIGSAINEYNEYEENGDEDNDETHSSVINTNKTISFVKTLTNVTRQEGTRSIRLVCEIENLANTTARILWYKNNAPIDRNERIIIRNYKNETRLRSVLRIIDVDTFDKGYYECIAHNTIHRISSQGLIMITPDAARWGSTDVLPTDFLLQDDELKTIRIETRSNNVSNAIYEPYCQVYRGRICREFLADKYVFVQPPHTQNAIEKKLTDAFLVISQSNDISSSCSKFAQPSLCYSAFPLCLDTFKINRYQAETHDINIKNLRTTLATSLRRICKRDCVLLETELCSKEYAIAKRHPVIGPTLELEECHLLPDDDGKYDCLELGVDLQNIDKEDTCFWDRGESYRGVNEISVTGTICLRWSHQFHIPLSEHPELGGHNYCRNPGGLENKPFCYVDQNRREECDVARCSHIVTGYVLVSFLVIGITFAIVLTLFCCQRKRNAIKTNRTNLLAPPSGDKNIYGHPTAPNSPIELNSLLPQQQQQPHLFAQPSSTTKSNAYQNVVQFAHKNLTFVEELGEGAFGKVYKGELRTKDGGRRYVAVKALKENANAKTLADFRREIELINELRHPNIVCLVGVIVRQEPMCMLFEFMSEGDLHEFLIANSPEEGKSLTHDQFLFIAQQIALGMEYLSDNHYVHRDLAARNCLVSHDLTVKISDFGLSRDMYSCDYYRVQSKSLLPVRWMPPESILYGKFTTESDIWSYGVVLWEIYSYGLQPYYGHNNQEVIGMIRSRKLLPCPDACPGYCYSLMVECWSEVATRRPKFGEIAHRLAVWRQQAGASIGNGCGSSLSMAATAIYRPPLQKLSSQSSLSSIGNRTQSTNLSDKRAAKKESNKSQVMVIATGSDDSTFEMKMTPQ